MKQLLMVSVAAVATISNANAENLKGTYAAIGSQHCIKNSCQLENSITPIPLVSKEM
jgi:hypothetical protein